MYSTGPATVALVEYRHGGMTMRAAKDLRELVSDLMHNSGDEFAMWCEKEAAKAAEVWRENARREAAGIHNDDCECEACIETYDSQHESERAEQA